ncbi:hypothetical protein LCGC14_2489580 [marine sediment metagenome]|uniref:Uncharacterized protein n=1 Tax=marine sediment metagenome TaxID=412755 RepID=A0A0F9B585_9ZZZZ
MMKNKKLEMKREVWEHFRQYRKTPIQKRYLTMLKEEELIGNKKQPE